MLDILWSFREYWSIKKLWQVTQYVSLFCVMNHIGQVMTWRLTPGVAFAKIESLLTALQECLVQQGKQVTEFYIDNCCAWCRLLQCVFGDSLKVYLDLFHAVKRISDKIHPLRRECMEDLRMVFRDPTDRGFNRTKETPSSAILIRPWLVIKLFPVPRPHTISDTASCVIINE